MLFPGAHLDRLLMAKVMASMNPDEFVRSDIFLAGFNECDILDRDGLNQTAASAATQQQCASGAVYEKEWDVCYTVDQVETRHVLYRGDVAAKSFFQLASPGDHLSADRR